MNSINSYQEIFEQQRKHQSIIANTNATERIAKLEKIRKCILNNLDLIIDATKRDLQKPTSETLISEVLVLVSEISYAKKHLTNWMKPVKTDGNLISLGTSAYIQHEPKGNVLIISPWNYPVNLAIKPLISAIAAGCVAIIKPSEYTPASSAFIQKMATELFDPKEVTVVLGDAEVSTELLKLPFNHLFFTGSTAVGKIVMSAAAKHLASVTLELGGKSPSIVDETCDIKATTRLIAWGKFFNNGQTCVAPDYLWVQESILNRFQKELVVAIQEMYGSQTSHVKSSDSYGRIINEKQFDRLEAVMEDALQKGGKLLLGGARDKPNLFMEPTVISNVSMEMKLMQGEIFGPVLPILSFTKLTEVTSKLSNLEKPLALYVHSKSNRNIDYVLKNTSSGNAVVNELLSQFGNAAIPFGGVNHSGIGKSNGYFGFQEFSNAKGVLKRRFGTLRFIYPPYSTKLEKLLLKVLRWV